MSFSLGDRSPFRNGSFRAGFQGGTPALRWPTNNVPNHVDNQTLKIAVDRSICICYSVYMEQPSPVKCESSGPDFTKLIQWLTFFMVCSMTVAQKPIQSLMERIDHKAQIGRASCRE